MNNKPVRQHVALLNKYIHLTDDGRSFQAQLKRYADGSISGTLIEFSQETKKAGFEVELSIEQLRLFDWNQNVWGYIKLDDGGWGGLGKHGNTLENIPDMRAIEWLTAEQKYTMKLNQPLLPDSTTTE